MNMNRFGAVLGAVAFVLAAAPAQADEAACKERFVKLLVGGNASTEPVRIHVTQTYAGNTTENYFYSMGPDSGDGMMQPLKNSGSMWVMFRDRKMYTSQDGGKTWKFGRELDAASDPAVTKEKLRTDSATAANTVCGEDALDGVAHETVEGEYVSSLMQGAKVYHKYWVNRDTGWISKTVTRSMAAGKESIGTQVLEPAPGFELPKVE
jgi:hypothetical protein